MSDLPDLGALYEPNSRLTDFVVWAPTATSVVLAGPGWDQSWHLPLDREPDGNWHVYTDESAIRPGSLYHYYIDGRGPFPDPASRYQPDGVHGPSQVVDPSAFRWTDGGWPGVDRDRLVIYELHVGTFTRQGTFQAAAFWLDDLADLGVTAIQLLPVNDFPGRWNWGYDGVALFAPARCYGTTGDLRALINHAHRLGLAVLLDVVYNHFGPSGNYTGQFSPRYVNPAHRTNWGPAINLGGEGSEHVRRFFIENARMWLREYHVDGFRLDATHAFVDDGPRPFLDEFAEAARAAVDRPVVLIAEDHRNLDTIIRPRSAEGWDFDGVWADDFHHTVRRYLTGDADGVFMDFAGTVPDLATIINRGWLKTGEYSAYREKLRGTDPAGIPPRRFVFCLQNHDRVGNRAGGRRLGHDVDPATDRAATALLLLAPQTPMLFQGQEWGASSPFFYFTDHEPELGRAIWEGRSREFRKYADFTDPARLATIPDPQLEATFLASKLDHAEAAREPHAATRRLYRALLRLRRDEPAFDPAGRHLAAGLDADTMVVRLGVGTSGELAVVVRLRGAGPVRLDEDRPMAVILTTEAPELAADPMPIDVVLPAIHFQRPGAVVLRLDPSAERPAR